jgi:hypothetical protein
MTQDMSRLHVVGANIGTWLINVNGKLEARRSTSRQKSALPWR